MRAYEFLDEGILSELKPNEQSYKGFVIKSAQMGKNPDSTAKFGATGTNHRGDMAGLDRKPHMANSEEEAIQIVKGLIDAKQVEQKKAGEQDRANNKHVHSLNFNTKFTDAIMNNMESTWVKLIAYNGDAAVEMATMHDIDSMEDKELSDDGFKKLKDRKFGKEGRAYSIPISAKMMKQLELDSGGRYLFQQESNNEDRLIYSMHQSGGLVSDKMDRLELPGPGVTVVKSTKGGQ